MYNSISKKESSEGIYKMFTQSSKNAFFISIIYFIAGVFWIVLSDFIVAALSDNAHDIMILQMYKGWFFVFVTTVILFLLSYKIFHVIHSRYAQSLEQIKKYHKTKETLKQIKEIVKASEIELLQYDKILKTIVNNSPDAIYAKDLDGKYIIFNDGASRMLNIDVQNILGNSDDAIFTTQDAAKIKEEDKIILSNFQTDTKEEFFAAKDGIKKTFLTTKGPLLNKDNEAFGVFGISRDISAQKKYEDYLLESKEKFYKLSHLDVVTSLPNRLYISEVLTAKCLQNSPFCLIFIDLDEFGMINDSYGHRFGDKLLFEISKVFKEVFDSTAFIARMGGDEFGIILNSGDKEEVTFFMQKLLDKFSNPFTIDFIDIYITASSGICIFPDNAKTMEDLYQEADAAMYNAKKRGKNRFSFYHSQFKKDAISYTQMVTNLKQAIKNEELELYFQLQNDSTSGEIVGIEALLRWRHQDKMIPPDIFIPLAEKSGLIIDIGNFVLRNGFKTVKRWHELGILKGRVAINISARQLVHLDFIKTLKAMLKETECEALWIELEITESSILENPKLTINLLQQMKALGFYISMDDFGTGYSSLSYLKNLPIDKLKIDKSFITNIQNEPKNQIIVKTIIFLAKELGIDILAEGVETQEEVDFLVENKIDSIQGYYYAKPMPLNEMEKVLQA
ncbi:MAG: EAL domain-containing protein [Sulfurimonas sp.]|nr:EAL domain-containing protein [Sulfurimonas sp.]